MSNPSPPSEGSDKESEEREDSDEETSDEGKCEYEQIVTSQNFKKKYQAQCQWNLTKPCADRIVSFRGDPAQIGKSF